MAFLKTFALDNLPDVAPKTRNTGLGSTISDMEVGDAGVVQYAASTVKTACKTINEALQDTQKPYRFFLVWDTDENGNVRQVTKTMRENKGTVYFALVARVDRETYFRKGGKTSGETE